MNFFSTLFHSKIKLSILIYHRVLPESDPLFGSGGDIVDFGLQLKYLVRNFKVLPLFEAVNRLRDGTLPARAACITFDDGYADNEAIALPLLNKFGLPATFFIAAGFLDGGRMWNDTVIESFRHAQGNTIDLREIDLGLHTITTLPDRRQALFATIDALKYMDPKLRQTQVEKLANLIAADLPDDLMMTADQVRTLHRNGMEIGGHTMNHPILARLDDASARIEIAEGKAKLEAITGAPVRFFAYPNGKPGKDYLPAHVAMLKELGFEAAVSTAWGAARHGSDMYQLPRFTPWDKSEFFYVLRMLRNMMQAVQTV
ncbi:Peptidoglycan/xylan/chitin deacetylase, PgdA/CDA1 family [Nitrosomonas halophila]|uniref:Peptidoglycan/xylan/chitin deacetylase, PgdA/CDA1 family n=1 Tax=Nitrosomonas halophila TaxID=44576 RepID=A0A1H3J2Z2_9PROT|nr:Peptidoglycan/xylan/chitin deacetylase, PgdA/CDA1 family [Nitrosomonas halophila]